MGLTGVQTGQGADGFMMHASDLKDFEDFIESVQEPCFKVDDLSVSEWLTNYAKRPVKSLEEKQQNVDACGLVKMPIYKANCWTVEDTHNKETGERQICRPTITSVNSLRGDKATGGRGEDMKRCADALAAKREEKKKTFPDVAVCMTTIPSHLTSPKGFAALKESLSSVLLEQTYRGNITGYLAVPSQASVREGAGYPEKEAEELVSSMKGKLVIVPIEHDVGPGSRYLGCAKRVKDPDTLVVSFDDDIAYESETIAALACAKRHDPEFSWTGHRFMGLTGVQTGQGADGFMMHASDLKGFEDFIDSVQEPCFKVDDLSVSEWLTNYANRPVKSLEDRQDYNADVCGLVTMPIYKANCWTVEDTHNKKTSKRQICRPTVTSFNSLRGYKATSGHAEDMKRCADALAAKREEKNSTESSATDEIAAGIE
jgi:hypothetical protein